MENVTIVRSKRRSSIGIQIMPDGSVKVTAPYLVPKFFITRLLKNKTEWIIKQQEKLKNRNTKQSSQHYFYLGKQYLLERRQQQQQLIEVSDKLYIASPNEKYLTTYLESWYKQQARKIIFERVHLYAKKAGLQFTSLHLTGATTRWGSCSSQKSLNFNWKLVMAPLEVIDYVVCHELAHLTEMNHSVVFWERVRKMFPVYRQYRTWLKRHGHLLTI
ncbi:MAG TPA: SprT family zinc-dependent metalloprotease [Patescibacteria group bacterium]|nr:SprT family zinc-dependent metalloprotease [Patescibacteria group bacterium]